jgi:hypothetical protein
MPQSPLERWQPPAQYYGELVARARKHDSKVIAGGASTAEIARMEKLVDRLEKQAAEGADAKRRNDPRNITLAALNRLWHRGHDARQAISKMQAERLGKKSPVTDDTFWHAELQALNPPPEFFKTPQDIGSGTPSFRTLAEADTLAAELSVTVAALEALASKMSRFLNEWEELSFEQQTRRLLMAHINAGKVGG